jgi:hypothetical protein
VQLFFKIFYSELIQNCIYTHKHTQYPIMYAMALDYIPIQASAVPCERIFSSGKETLTTRRSRISQELMEQLQILKFAFKHNQKLSFTAGTDMESEINAMEGDIIAQSNVPEEVHSFIAMLRTLA